MMNQGAYFFLASLALFASPAHASDKPENGAVPDWVKPVALPTVAPATDAAPVHILSLDRQWRFQGDVTSIYTASAVRIDKAEGLAAMGTVAVQWKPDSDRVIVHGLDIRRGSEVIDVLKRGQKFTVLQRENNLELAMIDGILTASLSLEGLRVGDIVELAYTLERSEPILAGHHDIVLDAGTGGSVAQLSISGQWDSARDVATRSRNLPAELVHRSNGLSLQASSVEPLVQPQGAPPRFQRGRYIEVSDYRDWGDISTIFTPLFDTARKLQPNSPLLAEIARIRAASPDPATRAALALRLVQDDVRYLYIGLNQSNLRPASADDTWKRRFGDCKAKTALLLAMLNGLGITAEAALVSSGQGDGLNQRLPSASLFDHVIARVSIGGRIYWVDGTRLGDRSLAAIRVPGFHWALPLHRGSDRLEALVVQQADAPNMVRTLTLDSSKGILVPATVHGEFVMRGDAAQYMRRVLAAVSRVQLETSLKTIWRKEYDFITPERVSERWDDATGTDTLFMDGTAKMDWNMASNPRYYEIDGALIGWNGDYHRDAGPDNEAPFDINFPDYTEYRETVILPDGGEAFSIDGPDLNETIAQRALYRHTEKKDGVITMIASQKPLATELSFADAQSAKERLRTLAKRGVYINAGDTYSMTPDDLRVTAAMPGEAEVQYKGRVASQIMLGNFLQTLAEAQRYVAAWPKSALALGTLAQSQAMNGHRTEALDAAGKAISIDPDNGEAKSVRKYYEWFDSLDAGVIGPDFYTSGMLAASQSCRSKQQYRCALRAIDAAVSHAPKEGTLYVERANIYRAMKQPDEAARQADLMITAAPLSADMLAQAGVVYCSTGQCQKGLKAFGDSIAIKPSITAFLNRIRYLPAGDQAGRKRDIDAALKLNSASTYVLTALAQWQHDNGDAVGEAATVEKIKGDDGTQMDPNARLQIAQVYVRAGQAEKARAVYAELRGFAAGRGSGALYNGVCYSEAQLNFDLELALSDCRKAVTLQPGSGAIIDSLAFVELRLSRYGEAIADYDKAVALSSDRAPMLFGRGIAKLRKGEKIGGDADIAAAKAKQPDIAEEFKKMGVSP
jgi:tetratricopeptide (TPR) repeat protein